MTPAGAVFAALADPTRRDVLDAVAGGRVTATEVASVLDVSRQAVAKHLVQLRQAGLVTSQRAGRETRYAIRPGSLRPAADWIARTEEQWASRVARLQRHLARSRRDPEGAGATDGR